MHLELGRLRAGSWLSSRKTSQNSQVSDKFICIKWGCEEQGMGTEHMHVRLSPSIDTYRWGGGTKYFVTVIFCAELQSKCHAEMLVKSKSKLKSLFKECLPETHQKCVMSFSNNDAHIYFFRPARNAGCILCSCFVTQKELMKLNCISAYLRAEPHESRFALKENTEQFPASLAFYLKRRQQFIFQSVQGFPLLPTPPSQLRHWYH